MVNLLRPAAYSRSEGAAANGWTIDGNSVIVWEPRDAFGRSGFSWEDVPSTLIDQDASGPGRTVLNRTKLEEFTKTPLRTSTSRWKLPFGL